MRKTILTQALLTLLIISQSWSGSAVAEKRDPVLKKVEAAGGLRMRSQPDLKAAHIITIPDGAEITVLGEKGSAVEISGKKGKWTKISYDKKEGWVFGGFLTHGSSAEKEEAPIDPDELKNKTFSLSLEPDEELDAFTFSLSGKNRFESTCYLGGSGVARIKGTYKVVSSGEGSISIIVNGDMTGVYVTDTETKLSGKIKAAEIRIYKRHGKTFCSIKGFQECTNFQDRELVEQ